MVSARVCVSVSVCLHSLQRCVVVAGPGEEVRTPGRQTRREEAALKFAPSFCHAIYLPLDCKSPPHNFAPVEIKVHRSVGYCRV